MECRRCDGGPSIFPKTHTRYEKARIVGAIALQVAMGAPVLVELQEGMIDPVDIALYEYEKGVVPITVVRRTPGEKKISAPA